MIRSRAQVRKPASRQHSVTLPTRAANPAPVHPAVRQILRAPLPQAKLTVGAPGDPCEREADRVAEQVMRMPEPQAGITGAPAQVQRSCAHCREEERDEPVMQRMCTECEKELRAKEEPGKPPAVPEGFEQRFAALAGGGQPLSATERAFFEPRFGRDFGAVRLHSGPAAGELARSVHARAFTLGDAIVLGAGQYAPGTGASRQLLAHELTHVAQQRGGGELPSSRATVLRRSPDAAAPAKKSSYFAELLQEARAYRLKGTEPAGLFTVLTALHLGLLGTGGQRIEGDLSNGLSVFNKYVEELAPLTPTKAPLLDLGSLLSRAALAEYFDSPDFDKRLERSKPYLIGGALLALAIHSGLREAISDDAHRGELVPTRDSKHPQLLLLGARLFLPELFKTPANAFTDTTGIPGIGTSKLYDRSFLGGPPPSSLNYERLEAMGEPGSKTSVSGAINLVKLAHFLRPRKILPGLSLKDIGDLARYRGPQVSLYGNYYDLKPPETTARGQLPEQKASAGGIIGISGLMVLGEGGMRQGPAPTATDQVEAERVQYVKGGLSYTLPETGGIILTPTRFGLTGTYFRGTGGDATRIAPFLDVRLGTGRHRVGIGGSLSFLTSKGSTSVSEARGNFSYSYLDKRGADRPPVFLFDIGGSFQLFDPHNPKSPRISIIEAKAILKYLYFGLKLGMGGQEVSPALLRAMDPDLVNQQLKVVLGVLGVILETP